MGKIDKKMFLPLDQEEKDLMESLDSDDWQPVQKEEKEKKVVLNAARNTLKKEMNPGVRLCLFDKKI